MLSVVEKSKAVFLAQRDRWVLWIPVGLAVGDGVYFALRAEPPLFAGLSALVFLLLAALPVRKNRAALLLGLPFLLIVIGFTAAQWRTWSLSTPMLARKTHTLTVEGRVAAVETLAKGFRLTLDQLQFPADTYLPQSPMPEKVRVVSKVHQPPPAAGDVIRVKAVLLPLSPPVMPGAYDFQRRAFFDGLGATGYAVGKAEVINTAPPQSFFFAALRRYIHTHINDAIADKDTAAVTAGLLVGESKGISDTAWENIRLSGLAHLLAIAGLHTGTVTGWLFFMVRLILAAIPFTALRWPVKKISAAVSIAGAIFYLCLVNFSLPAERAVIMVCVVMTGVIFDRDPFSLRLLAFAAALILLFRPESLVGVSFQMSFAAVGALIAFYEGTRGWWQKLYQDKRWSMKVLLFILGSVATTGIATLGTAPFALFHFFRVPFISGFIANLVAVPVAVFLVLPVGIISCLLMPLGLDVVPLKIVGAGVSVILKVAELTAHWPYASLHTNGWPLPLLLLMCAGGLWVCLWRGRLRWLGVAPALLGIMLIPLTQRADILAAEGGKLFAVRSGNGDLLLQPGRAEKFTRNIWREREGANGAGFWPENGVAGEGAPISCDAEACLYHAGSHTVSFIRRYDALQADCATADIVISNLYIDREACATPKLLLDRGALWHNGATAIYFKDDGSFEERSVGAMRGRRPWIAD